MIDVFFSQLDFERIGAMLCGIGNMAYAVIGVFEFMIATLVVDEKGNKVIYFKLICRFRTALESPRCHDEKTQTN